MDDLYIKKIKKGDYQAYNYFIRQYQSVAMRTALAIVKNEADAKDIVQISFIKAYEALDSFENRSNFSSWLCRIVINNCFSYLKKQKTRYHHESSSGATFMGSTNNEAENHLEKQDQNRSLKEAMAVIPPNEALCLQLHYLEEYTIKEIIALTGFSEANIKVLLHRGRKHLHALLKPKQESKAS